MSLRAVTADSRPRGAQGSRAQPVAAEGDGRGSAHRAPARFLKQLLETETAHEQARVLSQVSQGKLAAAEEALKEAKAAPAESDAQAQQQGSKSRPRLQAS
jgi:hypothetical protein